MKKTLFILFCLIALAHTMAYQDEQQQEDETMLAVGDFTDSGVGCIDDCLEEGE